MFEKFQSLQISNGWNGHLFSLISISKSSQNSGILIGVSMLTLSYLELHDLTPLTAYSEYQIFVFICLICSTCLSYKRAYSEYQIFENDVYKHIKISGLGLSEKSRSEAICFK